MQLHIMKWALILQHSEHQIPTLPTKQHKLHHPSTLTAVISNLKVIHVGQSNIAKYTSTSTSPEFHS